jgi:hypothetical protein
MAGHSAPLPANEGGRIFRAITLCVQKNLEACLKSFLARVRSLLALYNCFQRVVGARENPGSPSENRTREWQAIARTFVPDFSHGIAASELDASLWLAAHEDYKLCVLTGLRAQLLIGDDQRSSRTSQNRYRCSPERLLVAHRVRDVGVAGSNPATPTKIYQRIQSILCLA